MQVCTFELIINILTYALKHNNSSFSQKDFKNVVYTKEFHNFDINDKISQGFEYLLKRGLLQLENNKMKFFEKYKLPSIIRVNTQHYTKVLKELSKKIILMNETQEIINTTYKIKYDFAEIIEVINDLNFNFLLLEDKTLLEITLSKILISLNMKVQKSYSLLTIIQLLKLKSKLNIKIQTTFCEFTAKNVRFDYLQFNDNSLSLYFNKCSFEIRNLADILSVKSVNSLPLEDNILSSLKVLNKYTHNDVNILVNFLNGYLNKK